MKKIRKFILMRPRAGSGKAPTRLSLCWSEENEKNSYLCGPGRGQERPQHDLAYVGVKKMKKIHTYAAQGGVRKDPNTT